MPEALSDSMKKIDAIISQNKHSLGGWNLASYGKFLAGLPYKIKELMEVEDSGKSLVLENLHYRVPADLIDPQNLTRIREEGKDLTIPLRGSFALMQDGKVISRSRPRLLTNVPFPTDMGTFILGGQEFNVSKQLRLSPGVYVTKGKDRRVKAQVNSSKRQNMDIYFDPDKHKFTFHVGGRAFPLHPIMSMLGVPEEQMQKAWGHTLYARNKKSGRAASDASIKLFNTMYRYSTPGTREENEVKLREAFADTEIDPWVTNVTLGKEFPNVSGEMLLAATQKALRVSSGKEDEDEREALHFKVPFNIGSMVSYAIERNANTIKNKIKFRLRKTDDIDSIVSRPLVTLGTTIKRKYNEDELARTPDQHNPLGMYHDNTEITFLGEGGISDPQMVTEKARGVHDSMVGFIDPLHTPEGSTVGMNIHMSDRATFEGDNLYQKMKNRYGEEEKVSPRGMYGKYVALPGQITFGRNGKPKLPRDGMVDVLFKGKMTEVPASKVDLIMHGTPNDAYSGGAHIPFLGYDMGIRAGVGIKQMGQALPLKNREAPLVRPLSSSGRSTGSIFHRRMNVTAPEDMQAATVTRVADHHIYLKDDEGKAYKIPMKRHYQINGDATINDEPIVRTGDRVVGGQVLAENQYSRDGETALGTNLDVAFMPFYGMNHQDGVVISEEAARKMTSLHSYEEEASRSTQDVFNKKKFLAHYPTLYKKKALNKLDDEGIILPGQAIEPGDPIMLKMTPQQLTEDDILMGNINKAFKKPLRRDEKTWDGDHAAIVRKVVKTKKGIRVYLETEEPAQIGDKLTNKHGAKGIITNILSPDEMPKYEDGTTPDILQAPPAVPSRMNTGQIMESMAGRLALKRGTPYEVNNFLDQIDAETLQKEMMDAGLATMDDKGDVDTRRTLILPNGKTVKAFAGPQYFSKLKQQAASYYSARGRKDKYDIVSRRPTKGPKMGPLGWYGMLAHGATENLKSTSGWVGEKNDDLWRAYETGQSLPSPKTTFAMDRMIGILNAAGINVKERGDDFQLLPLTDEDVDGMSSGEVPDPGNSVRIGKSGPRETLESYKGGLYDQKLFGGMQGKKYGHITLASKMPNPVFETPVKKLLGLRSKDYDALISGDKGVLHGKIVDIDEDNRTFAKYRGEAFEELLGAIDVPTQIQELSESYKKARGQNRDNIAKRIRYLSGLQKAGKKPTDYLISKIPVIAPQFRPVYLREDGSLGVSDLTLLYQRVGIFNEALKDVAGLPRDIVNENYLQLYNSARELQTTGRSEGKRQTLGALGFLKGGRPKTGHFMSKIMAKREAIGGRATIMPDPKLDIDEVRIPNDMAWKIFESPLMRRMVQSGIDASTANDLIEEKSTMASNMLNSVMEDNPVIMRRDPKLHKFNMLAFKAKRTPGNAIYMPPLVAKGFNADYDGNCVVFDTQITLLFNESSVYSSTSDIISFVEELKMKATAQTTVPVTNSKKQTLIITEIGDFPRYGKPIKDKNGADVYSIPDGFKVLSYNHETGSTGFYPITHFTVEQDCKCSLVKTTSREVEVSDNESLAVFDKETGRIIKKSPQDSVGDLVPVIYEIGNWEAEPKYESFDLGWFYGSIISDGWQSDGYVGYSKNEDIKRETVKTIARKLVCENFIVNEYSGKKGKNKYADSKKLHFRGKEFCNAVVPCSIDDPSLAGKRQAIRKYIPPQFLMHGSKEFLWGLFCGLIDGDGSLSWNHSKERKQFLANYSTSAPHLVKSIQLLCMRLGIKVGVSSVPPKGKRNKTYTLSFSTADLARLQNNIKFVGVREKQKWAEFLNDHTPLDNRDIIPLTNKERTAIRAQARKTHNNSIYVSVAKGYAARRCVAKLLASFKEIPEELKEVNVRVANYLIRWDKINEVTPTEAQEVFDFCVPDTKVFAVNGGLIIYDTMSVTIPIGAKAVQEAWDKLLPSKNLIKPGQERPIIQPSEETIAGLYAGSRLKKETGLKFEKASDIQKAYNSGELKPTDGISFGGKPTTVGRVMAMQSFPEEMRNYGVALTSGNIEKLLKRVAIECPNDYGKIVKGLKDTGDTIATEMGLSFRARDFMPIRNKSELVNISKRGITAADKTRINNKLRKHLGEDSILAIMADSGAKGSWDNIRQMLYSPIQVQDTTGKTLPRVIQKGYAEGLSFRDYWTAAKGSRKGIVDKGVETARPGYFGKEILRSSLGGVIQKGDADEPEGIDCPVTHSTALNRYLAGDVVDGAGNVLAKAGDPVTSELVQSAQRLKIKNFSVRSPLTTKANDGLYAKDFGRMPGNKKMRPGTDIGIIAGHTLTEPATQVTLKRFHAGGTGEAASIAGLDTAWDILKGKAPEGTRAPLSPVNARVMSITKLPSGAGEIILSNGKKITTTPGLAVKVKTGDAVKKGQQLQDGNPDPREVLRYRGHRAMQMYMVDQIEKAFGKEAPDRRYIETVVGNLTRYGEVGDPGDSDYIPGEIIPINHMRSYNNKAIEGARKINFTPKFLGIGPSGVRAKSDWASAMLHGDIARRIPDLAAAGAVSPIHGVDPTMPYLHSTEFGEKQEEGQY